MRELSDVAALFADRSRARMLDELMSGGGLPAGVLAARAGIAPSTASKHLAKLEAAGLVTIAAQGRVREVRLAGSAVAEAVETLGRLAESTSPSGLRDVTRMEALRRARTCYDHLAGQLGVSLTEALVDRGALNASDGGLTIGESAAWTDLRIDIDRVRAAAGRRPLARVCLDWTERRPHIAGAIGAAILRSLHENQWVRRRPGGRALSVTPAGCEMLTAFAGRPRAEQTSAR
jgi:DNA-binding transcriptional ArsR family regulator